MPTLMENLRFAERQRLGPIACQETTTNNDKPAHVFAIYGFGAADSKSNAKKTLTFVKVCLCQPENLDLVRWQIHLTGVTRSELLIVRSNSSDENSLILCKFSI